MKKSNEPIDYLAAMEQMRPEEQSGRNQIHSPDYIPPADTAVDYIAASKAWDKALRDRDIINMPARPE